MKYLTEKITFKHPEKKDLNLILAWFNKPHVREFFDDPETEKTIPDLKNYLANKPHFITHWVGYYDQKPFAYLLTSEVKEGENTIYSKWGEKLGSTYTLDLLIGEEKFLGKGLSHLLIKKFIHDQLPHASAVLIDPEVRNTKAIHCYEKAGFIKVEKFLPEVGKFGAGIPHVLMKLNLKVEKCLSQIYTWATQNKDIHAVFLVGSHAREQASPTSDIDLVILVDDPNRYLADHLWAEKFGKIEKHQTEYYGKITSVRVYYNNGLEVEYGFTKADWINLPIDPGTKKVISKGIKVIYDPENKLQKILIF